MVGAESGTAPAEETFAVYNGRYHGGWANVHSSSNATIAITSENIKVQIATADVGPLPDASPGRRLTWSDVKTFRIDRTLFGSEEVGRGVYSQINIGIATGSTVAFDVPNVEPLEIWRALDRVQAFRDRIPDRIAAQISASPILSSTRGSPSLAAPAVQSDSPPRIYRSNGSACRIETASTEAKCPSDRAVGSCRSHLRGGQASGNRHCCWRAGVLPFGHSQFRLQVHQQECAEDPRAGSLRRL